MPNADLDIRNLGRTMLTGATGFIGRHVAARLSGEGVAVRGLIRSQDTPPCIEPVEANGLLDRRALRDGLKDVETVIHLAARVHKPREKDRDALDHHRRVNVEGTRILMEEAEKAGAKRFLFTSSVKAIGEGSEERWDDRTIPSPLDPYGITKLEAERVVRERSEMAGIHAPVLRLPLVYGSGMKGNLLRLFDLVASGFPIPLGRVENRRSMMHVGNVVEAIIVALLEPATAQETFLVSDGEDLSTKELVRRIARVLNRPARLIPIPLAVLRSVGRLGGGLFSAEDIDRLTGSLCVDASRFTQLTGFRPPFSVDEGLEETARWYSSSKGSGTPMNRVAV